MEMKEVEGKAVDKLKKIVEQKGMPIAEICRRAGLPYELIRRSLVEERSMKVDEFISICKVLKIEFNEFIK